MKISIHRALAELKLLEKRIERASMENFIGVTVGDKAPKGYSTVDEFQKAVQASYDSVTSLINRRNTIKNAIIKSNAETEVTISGQKYKVAEAIDQKAFIENEENLLRMMKKQYQTMTDKLHRDEEMLERNLTAHLEVMFGTKDTNNLSEDQEVAKKAYLARHAVKLVDPISLRDKIEKLEKKIEDFKTEIDYTLSESNASTSIDIPDSK